MFAQRDFGFGAWSAACGPGFSPFGRRGPGRRMFNRGDLKYVILGLLAEKPMHGYEVIRTLEEESGGCYSPSPGSVYPTLQMLEDQGYVDSEQADGKKTYRITDEGRAFLAKHAHRTDDIFDRFLHFGERYSGTAMRELTRSFVRLGQVSFERVVGGEADPAAMARLKEILDRARAEVEAAWPEPGAGAPSEG